MIIGDEFFSPSVCSFLCAISIIIILTFLRWFLLAIIYHFHTGKQPHTDTHTKLSWPLYLVYNKSFFLHKFLQIKQNFLFLFYHWRDFPDFASSSSSSIFLSYFNTSTCNFGFSQCWSKNFLPQRCCKSITNNNSKKTDFVRVHAKGKKKSDEELEK